VGAAWGADDEAFARDLAAAANVIVLPGRYLARDAHGVNPGEGRVRLALVPTLESCTVAAQRTVRLVASRTQSYAHPSA
jgi:N-succinyldiaminopimelate aminotransferase